MKTRNVLLVVVVVVVVLAASYLLWTANPGIVDKIQPDQKQQGEPEPSSSVVSVSEDKYDGWVDLEPYPYTVEQELDVGRYRVTYKTDVQGVTFKAYRAAKPAFYKILAQTDGASNFDINNGEGGMVVFVFGNESLSTATKGYLKITKVAQFE